MSALRDSPPCPLLLGRPRRQVALEELLVYANCQSGGSLGAQVAHTCIRPARTLNASDSEAAFARLCGVAPIPVSLGGHTACDCIGEEPDMPTGSSTSARSVTCATTLDPRLTVTVNALKATRQRMSFAVSNASSPEKSSTA